MPARNPSSGADRMLSSVSACVPPGNNDLSTTIQNEPDRPMTDRTIPVNERLIFALDVPSCDDARVNEELAIATTCRRRIEDALDLERIAARLEDDAKAGDLRLEGCKRFDLFH